MRRRALLAASVPSGGSGTFFAEFYFDYCEELFFSINCYRAADENGVACRSEAVKLLQEYGTMSGSIKVLDNPLNYGFEVYLEGAIVNRITEEYGTIFLNTDGEYSFARINQDGSLEYEM